MSMNVTNKTRQQLSRWLSGRRLVCAIVSIVLLIAVIATISIPKTSEPGENADSVNVTADDVDLPDIGSSVVSGYVGPQACVDCHRERVAEFLQTKHFQACREPRAEEMPKGFLPGFGRFPSRDPQIVFEMTQTNQGFFETAIQSTSAGSRKTSSKIELVYGSPPNDEVYFSWQGDQLFELPVAWLHPQQEWGASTFNPDSTGDFSRPMSVRCLECHTTWFQHIPGTMNRFQRDHSVLGVTCERCHGPAASHVDFHKAHPEQRQAQSILHPGHLSRELLIDVCTQCHSNAIKHKGPAFSYRPGQPLDQSYRTVESRYPEEDHVANQITYLRQSRCFQQSNSMTCITCHNPHQPSHSTPGDERHAIQSCLSCHSLNDCHERSQLPTGVQDKCISCHMPAHNKIQVYFDMATEAYVPPVKAFQHRIGVDPIATKTVLREWHLQQAGDEHRQMAERLSRELVQHWHDEADQRRREFRHLASIDAYRQVLRLEANPEVEQKLKTVLGEKQRIDGGLMVAARQIRLQQYSEAAVTLEEILRLKPNLAQAHGKLGSVYATLGDRDRATTHLQAVREHDPDDAYGEAMLGWLDTITGHYQSASEHYRLADEIEPYKAKLQYQWGLALLKAESWTEAEAHFRQALTIDPSHSQACLGLSQSLKNQGQIEKSIAYARQAVKITDRKQPEALLNLAECFAENKQLTLARQAAEEALLAALQSNNELISKIQRRLMEYQDR